MIDLGAGAGYVVVRPGGEQHAAPTDCTPAVGMRLLALRLLALAVLRRRLQQQQQKQQQQQRLIQQLQGAAQPLQFSSAPHDPPASKRRAADLAAACPAKRQRRGAGSCPGKFPVCLLRYVALRTACIALPHATGCCACPACRGLCGPFNMRPPSSLHLLQTAAISTLLS